MVYRLVLLTLLLSSQSQLFSSIKVLTRSFEATKEGAARPGEHLEALQRKVLSLSVDSDSHESLRRAMLIQGGYVVLKSLNSDARVLVSKADVKEFLSKFCKDDHVRPSRNQDNPFVLSPCGNEPIRFTHSYKDLGISKKKGCYRELPSYQELFTYIGDERSRFSKDFLNATFSEYQIGDKRWGKSYYMDRLSHENFRVLTGPDTNRVVSFFDEDQNSVSICYLYCDKEDWAPGGIAFNHPLLGYGLVREFQNIQYPLAEGGCDVISAISLFKGFPREEYDKDGYALWEPAMWDRTPCEAELRSMENSVLLTGTRSGKVFVHYVKPTIEDIQYTQLPLKLTGRVRDLRINKDAKVAWVLDEQALHSYNLETQEQQLVCKLPENFIGGTDEFMKTLTLSADENYVLLGGSKGTVLLVDVCHNSCYELELMPPHEIVDMWWSEKNEIVILNKSGMIKSFKLSVLST